LVDGDHVFHLLCVEADDRDAFRAHLAERGVATAVHYPIPIHRQEAYAHLGMSQGSLPVVERLADRICSLPLFPAMTETELASVIDAVHQFGVRQLDS
jgi:dTDP-4-amino-4,6-dideoxygalactose transaminase